MVQADPTPTPYLGIEFGTGAKRAKATGSYVELLFDNKGSIEMPTRIAFDEEGKANGDLNEVFSKLRELDPDTTTCVISFDPMDDAVATETI